MSLPQGDLPGSETNTIYLLIGGISMLASALGALISQVIGVIVQRRQQRQQELLDERKFGLDTKKADVDASSTQLNASTQAVSQTFTLLTECMSARAQLQLDIRNLTLAAVKKDIKIQRGIAELDELLEKMENEDACNLAQIRTEIAELAEMLKANGNGIMIK